MSNVKLKMNDAFHKKAKDIIKYVNKRINDENLTLSEMAMMYGFIAQQLMSIMLASSLREDAWEEVADRFRKAALERAKQLKDLSAIVVEKKETMQ